MSNLETTLDHAATLLIEQTFLLEEQEAASYSLAADILSAMRGYFSEHGTTREQDLLLEAIGIKPTL